MTGLKGLEYFEKLNSLSIGGYNKTAVDLTKSDVESVLFVDYAAKSISLNAPNVKRINFSIANEKGQKLEKVDLSKCNKAKYIHAFCGDKYVTVKLPSSGKALLSLTLRYLKDSTLNLNKYTNLLEFSVLVSKTSTIKADKCKSLRYAYFYCDDNLRSVNLSRCKNLKALDVYSCNRMKAANVKTVKGCKKTDGKGSWWWGTEDYKNKVSAKVF